MAHVHAVGAVTADVAERADGAAAPPPVAGAREADGVLTARSAAGRAIFTAFAARAGAADVADAMRRACAALRQTAGEPTPPIALQPLLQALGATRRDAELPTDGRLELVRGPMGDRFVVLVRRGVGWRRQRFTVAHEIGHILLLNALAPEPRLLASLRTAAAWRDVERLCNFAAAELLVPGEDVAAMASSVDLTPGGLRTLSDRYLVSMAAILGQARELVRRSTITLWRNHARRIGEVSALRVVQSFRGPDGPYIPTGMTARHLSADLVSAARAAGTARSSRLWVDTSRKFGMLTGVAAALPTGRRSDGEQLPMFQGYAVPDEAVGDGDVILWLRAGGPADPSDALWSRWLRAEPGAPEEPGPAHS